MSVPPRYEAGGQTRGVVSSSPPYHPRRRTLSCPLHRPPSGTHSIWVPSTQRLPPNLINIGVLLHPMAQMFDGNSPSWAEWHTLYEREQLSGTSETVVRVPTSDDSDLRLGQALSLSSSNPPTNLVGISTPTAGARGPLTQTHHPRRVYLVDPSRRDEWVRSTITIYWPCKHIHVVHLSSHLERLRQGCLWLPACVHIEMDWTRCFECLRHHLQDVSDQATS